VEIPELLLGVITFRPSYKSSTVSIRFPRPHTLDAQGLARGRRAIQRLAPVWGVPVGALNAGALSSLMSDSIGRSVVIFRVSTRL